MPPTVPTVAVPDHTSERCRALIADSDIRLLVNGGTPRRLPTSLINTIPYGVLNVHPGILPGYRGASACEWAILNDDPVGVTAHFMDAELDGGPILFVRQLPILRGQQYTEVRVELYRLWLRVVVEATALIMDGGVRSDMLPPQPESAVRRRIPDEMLSLVRRKLESGTYGHAQ